MENRKFSAGNCDTRIVNSGSGGDTSVWCHHQAHTNVEQWSGGLGLAPLSHRIFSQDQP